MEAVANLQNSFVGGYLDIVGCNPNIVASAYETIPEIESSSSSEDTVGAKDNDAPSKITLNYDSSGTLYTYPGNGSSITIGDIQNASNILRINSGYSITTSSTSLNLSSCITTGNYLNDNLTYGTFQVTPNSDNSLNVQIPLIYGTGTSLTINSVGVVDSKQMLKSFIRSNLGNRFSPRQRLNQFKVTVAETKARDTLRDLLTEKDWRRYITNGFIMVKSPTSNKWYQIFNDYRRINVYLNGKITQNICIHTDVPECPPTDHVLNMLFLVEHSEHELYKLGNVSSHNMLLGGYILGSNTALDVNSNLLDYSQSLKKVGTFHIN